MELSLGFIVVLTLILFPGLIFRRLYFYGEFSKEFKSQYNLISLLAISTIPGIINLICVFFFYDNFFTSIDLGEIIDKFKDLNSSQYRHTQSNDTPIKDLLNSKAAPFIGFLYVSSILAGSVFGRFVRISRIDTKFKLLRFKNYWFYLFNGQHTNFKRMKHLKIRNKKHLFTKADILIDSNSDTLLYSGIVVDYELKDDDCSALSKVILQNAERYKLEKGKRIATKVPGNLLVVDCSSMKNINLRYIFEESASILKSKLPNLIEVALGIISLLLLPVFIFRAESFNWSIYQLYFSLSWYEKIFAYLLTVQLLSVLNPFTSKKGEYLWISIRTLAAKIIWILALGALLWILN